MHPLKKCAKTCSHYDGKASHFQSTFCSLGSKNLQKTKPERIVWLDGSDAEYEKFLEQAAAANILKPLNQEKNAGLLLQPLEPKRRCARRHLTFICTPTKEEAGPTNNWMAPNEAYDGLFDGAMKGRTMYVVPYIMGPAGSPMSKIGVELTDSVYVAINMRIMTRMGKVALDMLGSSNEFNRGLHSTLDCNPERRYICHFPQDNTIWSVGSGYGGNVLLGKNVLHSALVATLVKKKVGLQNTCLFWV